MDSLSIIETKTDTQILCNPLSLFLQQFFTIPQTRRRNKKPILIQKCIKRDRVPTIQFGSQQSLNSTYNWPTTQPKIGVFYWFANKNQPLDISHENFPVLIIYLVIFYHTLYNLLLTFNALRDSSIVYILDEKRSRAQGRTVASSRLPRFFYLTYGPMKSVLRTYETDLTI